MEIAATRESVVDVSLAPRLRAPAGTAARRVAYATLLDCALALGGESCGIRRRLCRRSVGEIAMTDSLGGTPAAPAPRLAEWRKMPRETKDWYIRRALAAIRNAFGGRPVCWRCWRPFSDWFTYNGWSYCWPCHAETRIVILEPAAKRAPFYD